MLRMVYKVIGFALLGAAALSTLALAEGTGFSGTVGVEFTFTPIPPLSYNIESDVSASFTIDGFSLANRTAFDLSGFKSLQLDASLDLGTFKIGEEILFDPDFSWNDFSLAGKVAGVKTGLDLILANIGSVQTPSYSMGAVLTLKSGLVDGFSITSLTGFGATNLVNALDGIEAPFSHDLLYLYYHLATLSAPAPEWKVTIVPGFYFEEELIRLKVDTSGILASSTTWLNEGGFAKEIGEFGYRFTEPNLSFLTAITMDRTFSLSGLDFILDIQIDPVRFTSETSFSAPTPPASIPIVFSGQRFALAYDCQALTVTSETDFDDSFMFSRELIGIESTIDPVSFTSLTSFDTGGFSGEWIEAQVKFAGVTLSTGTAFDFTGITEVTFGFTLNF